MVPDAVIRRNFNVRQLQRINAGQYTILYYIACPLSLPARIAITICLKHESCMPDSVSTSKPRLASLTLMLPIF